MGYKNAILAKKDDLKSYIWNVIDIKSIINSLSEEEKKDFIKFQKDKNKRKEDKNIALFRLLSKETVESKKAEELLYPERNKAAYLAVRKRLFKSLVEFIALNKLENDKSHAQELEKNYQAALHFFHSDHFKAGWKLLDIAESKALKNNQVELLHRIYKTKIQFSYTDENRDLTELISEYEENKKQLENEEKLNIAYGKIKRQLKETKYKGRVVDFKELFEDAFESLDIPLNAINSAKSLYQLLGIIRSSALITKDYFSVEPFIEESYQSLKDRVGFTSKDKKYQINILYIVAHTMFRNKRFEDCLSYLDELKACFPSPIFSSGAFVRQESLRALALNYSGKNKEAIDLQAVILSQNISVGDRLNGLLNQVVFKFQAKQFKESLTLLNEINHSDQWLTKSLGIEYVIKRNLIEILLHIELHNFDLAEYKINNFEKNFKKYFLETDQNRVILFLKLVKQYLLNPKIAGTVSFGNQIRDSFTWVGYRKEDIYALSFFAWLKAKNENADTYECTISLLVLE